MKVSELNEDQLDHFVALALGGRLDGDGWRFDQPIFDGLTFIKTKRSFCREWTYGGPIIERERIGVTWPAVSPQPSFEWHANIAMERESFNEYGPTPLIAAMRAFVASKFGDDLKPSEEGPD